MDLNFADIAQQVSGFATKVSTTSADLNTIAGAINTVGLSGIEVRPILTNTTVNVPVSTTIKMIAPYLAIVIGVIVLIFIASKK